MRRRVVITGMGIYSCIGENKEQVVDSLYMGRSGIGLDPARKEMGYRSALTGILRKPDLKLALNRRQRTMLSEHGAYAYMLNAMYSLCRFLIRCLSSIQSPDNYPKESH